MQTTSSAWYAERAKRIIASLFGKIMNRRETIYPASISQSIINKQNFVRMPKPLKWGIENEKVALDSYTKSYL